MRLRWWEWSGPKFYGVLLAVALAMFGLFYVTGVFAFEETPTIHEEQPDGNP